MSNVYEKSCIGALLSENSYPGRGIIIGKTPDGTRAAVVYFIMGRSENSRNRIFTEGENGEVIILPFDESKVEDPSLIIYSPVKTFENNLIVTNGNQTDTVYDFLGQGKCFVSALKTREFEPDAPNFTPRISGMLTFADGDFKYKMSILKSADENGSACDRYTFDYSAIPGVAHFLSTYNCNGNPIPTFTGEPRRVNVLDDIDEYTALVWDNLNSDNKISMYVRYVNLSDGTVENRMINKFGSDR